MRAARTARARERERGSATQWCPHLSDRVGLVPEALHVLRHQRLLQGQAVGLVVRDDLRLQAVADVVAPRVKGAPGRAAAVHDVVMAQDLPRGRQAVDDWRPDVRAGVAQITEAQVIGHCSPPHMRRRRVGVSRQAGGVAAA